MHQTSIGASELGLGEAAAGAGNGQYDERLMTTTLTVVAAQGFDSHFAVTSRFTATHRRAFLQRACLGFHRVLAVGIVLIV
jgi:hypothetical protein